MFKSVVLSIFTWLYNYLNYLISEHFITLKKAFYTQSLFPQLLASTNFHFVSMDLHINEIIQYVLFLSGSFNLVPYFQDLSRMYQHIMPSMAEYMGIPCLISPFIRGWTVVLFPLFSYYECCSYKHSCMVIVWTYAFIFLGCIHKSGIAVLYGNSMFNLLRKCQTIFKSSCFVLHPHQ